MTASPPPARSTPATGWAVLASCIVALGFILISWGYVTVPWGDVGRWLYEIDRMAHGALPYRDVYWGFPPLAAWLVGGVARWVGSDLTSIWTITAGLTLAIAATYGAVVARLVPGWHAVPVAVTGMVLGAEFANQDSSPLALGMYTPAAPVAVGCLLLQVLAFLRDWDRPGLAGAALVGALGGAGLLAKHDVWLACGWLTVAAAVLTPDRGRPRAGRVAAVGGGFVLVAGSGVVALAARHGVGALAQIFTGYGQLAELVGVNFPNLSQLTLELATFGLGVATVASIARVVGFRHRLASGLVIAGGVALAAMAMAVWLWKTDEIARAAALATDALARPINPFGALRFQLLRHLVPLLMPLAVLGLAITYRRRASDPGRWRLLVVLLIACTALRSRRMISFTEWSELMLELPVYGLAVTVLVTGAEQRIARLVWLASGALLAVGAYAHWRIGRGIGSRRGVLPPFETARGTIRVAPRVANELAYLRSAAEQIDPNGRRPLFAFVYSGAFSYFLGRPSVGSLTHGFRMSLYSSPDNAYRAVVADRSHPILIDRPAKPRWVQATEFAPFRWEARMVEDHYVRIDRPLFERIKAGCSRVITPGPQSKGFSVYDCPPGDER